MPRTQLTPEQEAFQIGDRVEWYRTTNLLFHGEIVRCTHGGIGSNEVCFLRDEEESAGDSREWHPLRSQLQRGDGPGISAALQQTVQQLLAANNTNQGGTTMPETENEVVTISVPHTPSSRTNVFDRLNLYTSLMQNTDEEHWLQNLRDLQQVTAPVNWTIRKGSFMFDAFPEAMVNGYPVRIDQITSDLAIEFVLAASNGKVTLAEAEEGRQRWRLSPNSPLEKAAWTNYASGTIAAFIDDDGITQRLPLNALKNHMRSYHEYLTSGMRKQFIREIMRTRMLESAQKKVTSHTTEWNDRQITKFSEFLAGVKAKLVVEENPFSKLPLLPHKTLSSRTWGIEIEAPHIDGISTPEYWELKGDGSLRSLHVESLPSRSIDPTYTNPPLFPIPESSAPADPGPEPSRLYDHQRTCNKWTNDYAECNCEYVASRAAYEVWYAAYLAYRNQSQAQTRTGEWNSPVLRSFHSRGLKYLTSELEPRRVNNSAGCHVHVGAGDLTPDQAVRLSIIYTALEPLFQSEYKRGETRHFCQSVDVGELVNRFKKMKRAKEQGLPASSVSFGSRYWTVNLASLSSHNTVEFRAMGPMYNYEHLVKWAYFVRELVNIAKADVPQSAWSKVRTIEDVVTLFSKYGKETPTPDWAQPEQDEDLVAKIIESLGSENRRVPHTQALTPNSRVRLVNDDYTETRTYMTGERRLATSSF